MKKAIMLLLAALCTAATTLAYDFQSGDLYYNFTSDNTVEVTYQEYWSSTNYQGLTTATIPETVTYNGTTYSVTSIGDEAFYGCSSLTSITIPNSVTSIGNWAFDGCSSLTSITIPNSVTSIGGEAFKYCSSLTSVTIPNSVTSIGDDAFYGCSSLTSLTIPTSVTSIGDGAFVGCSSLTSITLPNSVTSIGDLAFWECTSLTSVTIPNSVTSIGEEAFYYCSSLTSVTIPNSVTSIGEAAFYYCSSLTSIVVESGNTIYDSRESCNAIIETASNTLIAGCQSTTIPNSVTSIGDGAFVGCSSLTSITLPNSVTSIGDGAFVFCSSLADIYCYATTPPVCYDNDTFYSVSKYCYIHVPAGTIPNYQVATGWSYFYNFSEISEETAISETEQQNKSSRKIIRDGQVLILRNGVTYDMMGNSRASL